MTLLEINSRKIFRKIIEHWNDPWSKMNFWKGNLKYFKLNKNKNIVYEDLWNSIKVGFMLTFIAINTYISNKEVRSITSALPL